MSQFDIGTVDIDVPCPACKRTTKVSLNAIRNRTARCACGVAFEPDESMGQGISQVNRSVHQLQRQIRRLGR